MPDASLRVMHGAHTFAALVLRQFRGHPFQLVFDTLRAKGFPVRTRDGLLVPEHGVVLSIRADWDTITYAFQQVSTGPGADQLDDGV